MKFKKRGRSRRPRTLYSITLPVVVFCLAAWLCVMGLITQITAGELIHQTKVAAADFVNHHAGSSIALGYSKITKESAGYSQICRLRTAHDYFPLWFNHNIRSSFPFIEDPSAYTFAESNFGQMNGEYAVYYAESSGKTQKTASYLYFPYMSEESWYAESEDYEGMAYVEWGRSGYPAFPVSSSTARLTGYLDGAQFIVQTIEGISGVEYKQPHMRDRLMWEIQYEANIGADKPLITLYTTDLRPLSAKRGNPITVDSKTYDDLLDMITQTVSSQEDIRDTIIIDYSRYTDLAGEDIYVAVGVRVNPLAFAIKKLAPFYIISFLIVAVAVGLYLWHVWRKLTAPLERITQAAAAGSALPEDVSTTCWQEPLLLQEYYATTHRTTRENQTEIKRLQTALEYSQNAEAHRRQMISNITHELKTPLAVIHSYAEGLLDGIAADKQAQYLDVILEETERMDGMVLEMLDLSRLEAGKVRLASDRFSLLELAQSIFEKLEPLSREKNLQIEYDLVEPFSVTADEGRIGQVITNFATNAIKYSPEGGKIWIKTYRHGEKAIFSVENQCEPLTEEALSQVFDSFYRAEQSRTTKGTGLGLAIAKAIVDLHGGTCHAINTSEGVEFRFTLP